MALCQGLLAADVSEVATQNEINESGIPPEVFAFLEKTLVQIDSVQKAGRSVKGFLIDKKMSYPYEDYPVASIRELSSMELSLTNGKWYEARWMDDNGNLKALLEFPANYELIYGLRKDEIEQKVKDRIKRASKEWHPAVSDYEEEDIIEAAPNLFKRKRENILEIKQMTDNVFLTQDNAGEFLPVFESNRKSESAINLLQGVIGDIQDYKLYIRQDKYDTKEEYTVDLSQWLNYCKSLPANVYCGLEEEREDGLKLLVILDVYPLGYRDMLSVIVPPDFVDKKNSVLKGKLYTYIPAHNVENMYYDLIYRER